MMKSPWEVFDDVTAKVNVNAFMGHTNTHCTLTPVHYCTKSLNSCIKQPANRHTTPQHTNTKYKHVWDIFS